MASWGNDNLTQFFDRCVQNQHGNREKFAAPYTVMNRVNDCFVIAGKNLVNPSPVLSGILFLRSQYAYKTAVGMALAGQAVEAFVMLRSCIEYAGYALVIFEDHSREIVFSNWHVDDTSMKRMKNQFQIAKIKESISTFDCCLSNVFNDLYQRTIDFGGHPNPHGTFQAMKLGDDNSITTLALTTDETVMLHTMKSTAQCGLLALFIFQHIFKSKFELLGIRAEMDMLRQEL